MHLIKGSEIGATHQPLHATPRDSHLVGGGQQTPFHLHIHTGEYQSEEGKGLQSPNSFMTSKQASINEPSVEPFFCAAKVNNSNHTGINHKLNKTSYPPEVSSNEFDMSFYPVQTQTNLTSNLTYGPIMTNTRCSQSEEAYHAQARPVPIVARTQHHNQPNDGSCPQKFLEPDSFDGSTNGPEITEYLIYFEQISSWNNWSDEQKALMLSIKLRGEAQKLLTSLSLEQISSYSFLKHALTQRFNPKELQPAYRFQFRNRLQHKDETPLEYGFALRYLGHKAYAALSKCAVEEILLDQFIFGLRSTELKQYVQLQHPSDLSKAIEYASEYEYTSAYYYLQLSETESKNSKLRSNSLLLERSIKDNKNFSTHSQMIYPACTSDDASRDLSSVLPIRTNIPGTTALETNNCHDPSPYTLDPNHSSRPGISALEPSCLGSHARASVHSHSPGFNTLEPNVSPSSVVSHASRPRSDTNANKLSSTMVGSHSNGPGPDSNFKYLYSPQPDASEHNHLRSPGPSALENNHLCGPGSNLNHSSSPRLDASELSPSRPGLCASELRHSLGPSLKQLSSPRLDASELSPSRPGLGASELRHSPGSTFNPSFSPRLDASELSPSRPCPGASELRHSLGSTSTKVSSRRLDASELSPSRPGPCASELRHSPRSTLTQLSSRRLDASELSPSRPGPCALETSSSYHSYCNTEINHMGSPRFDTSEQNAISPGQSALEIKHSCISHSNSKLDHQNSPGHCTSEFAHENSPGAHVTDFIQNSLEAQALENHSRGCQATSTLERHKKNNAANQDKNDPMHIESMLNKGTASSFSTIFCNFFVLLACLLQLSKLTISTVLTVWLLSCVKTRLIKHAILSILGIPVKSVSQLAYNIVAALVSFVEGIALVQCQGHIIKLWKRDRNKMQTALFRMQAIML